MLPGFTFITRRGATVQGRKRSAAERNVRPVESYSAQESPSPIRYGDTPARPSRQPIVTFLAISDWLSVQRDDFFIPLWAPAPHAQVLGGEQAPWNERGNVHKPAAEAYGSLVIIDPTDPYPYFPK